MGKIFYLMGKSSSGKDSMYRLLCGDESLGLMPIVLYTTRPIRDGETDGVQYHFIDEEGYEKLRDAGSVIEERVYHTIHGDWRYFTVDDGSIDTAAHSYIVIGTLESYVSFRGYFKSEDLVPIYLEVDDGERLKRALTRELKPENRKFKEMCRRYLADEDDFSEEKLKAAGIDAGCTFVNDDIDKCADEIREHIRKHL